MRNDVVFVGIKVPRDLATEIRSRARQDDRTVSSYIRRLIIEALARAAADSRRRGDAMTAENVEANPR